MSSASVALLGTGTMGAAMARRLAGSGVSLTVWNRTRSKAEGLADVATVADSVPEAVAAADVVLTMLHDGDSVLATMEQAEGHLRDGAVWVQHSTVGVEGSDWVTDCAAELGVALVDAPVLGTREPAEAGELVVLASGDPELRPRVQPGFDAIGSRTLWVADHAGAGSRLKLAVNAWLATVVEGTADSLLLARELGLRPELFLEAVRGSALDSAYLQTKGRAMLAGELEASFALSSAAKDVDLVLLAALEAGVDLAALPGIRAHLQRALDQGHGGDDVSATYQAH